MASIAPNLQPNIFLSNSTGDALKTLGMGPNNPGAGPQAPQSPLQDTLSKLFGGGAPQASSTNLAQYGASPYSSALLATIRNSQAPTDVTAGASTYKPGTPFAADAYQAKDMSKSALPQYDAMRTRLNSQYSQSQSQAQDALDRQFAAAGGGPGNGAQAKQTENLAAQTEQAKGNDLQAIDAQEAQTRQQLQQAEEQKAFQSGEAQKGYAFQSNQADLTRQETADEAAAARGLSAQEYNQQQQQSYNQFLFGGASSIANLNTTWDEAQQEAKNNQYNIDLNSYQQKHSGGLFGSGGFLGLGF